MTTLSRFGHTKSESHAAGLLQHNVNLMDGYTYLVFAIPLRAGQRHHNKCGCAPLDLGCLVNLPLWVVLSWNR
jgi:hypothetical protein